MSLVSIEAIRAAATALAGQVQRTPLIHCKQLSQRYGVDLYLKLETLQVTGSFKERGAFVTLSNLSEAERRRGVVAVSAGNHGQAVAYHATRLGIRSTIFMPERASMTKVQRTQTFGGEVRQLGDTLEDSYGAANALIEQEQRVLIHPFSSPHIIAGQGSIGLELLADLPEVDAVIVPVGGGGLISGIATAIKALQPKTKVIGVETERYASMYQTIHAGHSEQSKGVSAGATIADGIAVKRPGELTTAHVKAYVDDLIQVSEDEIETAIMEILHDAGQLAEGAAAASLAGLRKVVSQYAGKRVILMLCGMNIDLRLVSSLLLRQLYRLNVLTRVQILILDSPGVLAGVAHILGKCGANIVGVEHNRLDRELPLKEARLIVDFESRDQSHKEAIMAQLSAAGYQLKELMT